MHKKFGPSDVLKMMKDKNIQFVDFRFLSIVL